MLGFGIITGALKVLPLIVNAISAAEQLTEARGADKKRHALELVSDGLSVAEASSGRNLLDDVAVRDCAEKVIDAIVSLFKVLETRERADAARTD